MNEGPLNIHVDIWGLHWFIFIICLLKYHKNKWMLWVPLWGQRGQCEERSHSSWVCTSCLPLNHFSTPDPFIFFSSSCHISWAVKLFFLNLWVRFKSGIDYQVRGSTDIIHHHHHHLCASKREVSGKAVHVLVHHVDTSIHSW